MRARGIPALLVAPAAGLLSGTLASLTLWPSWLAGRLLDGPPDLGWLAWIAFVPVLLAVRRAKGLMGAVVAGYTFAAAWFAFGCQFLFDVHWLAWTLSVLLYGVYGAMVAVLLRAVMRAAPTWVWLTWPMTWSAADWTWSVVGVKYPWLFPAHSQLDADPLVAQVADLGGVWLVTFAILLVNATLAALLPDGRMPRSPESEDALPDGEARPAALRRHRGAVIATLVIVAVAHIYGAIRLATVQTSDGPVLALMQPNVPLAIGRSGDEADIIGRMTDLLDAVAASDAEGVTTVASDRFSAAADFYAFTRDRVWIDRRTADPVDLIVWPETAYPSWWSYSGVRWHATHIRLLVSLPVDGADIEQTIAAPARDALAGTSSVTAVAAHRRDDHIELIITVDDPAQRDVATRSAFEAVARLQLPGPARLSWFNRRVASTERLFELAREHSWHTQLNALDYRLGADLGSVPVRDWDTEFRTQNVSLLLAPDGEVEHAYAKIELVPVGEYVPLGEYTDLFRNLTADAYGSDSVPDYLPGGAPSTFHLPDGQGSGWRYGTAICFETAFPWLCRKLAAGGGMLLVQSNDAWFVPDSRESATPGNAVQMWQMWLGARYRAIENRVSVVRCVNSGISGLVGPDGAWRARFAPDTGAGPEAIGVPGALVVRVPLGSNRSLYALVGDAFPIAGWLTTLALVVGGWLRRRGDAGAAARADDDSASGSDAVTANDSKRVSSEGG